MENYNPEILRLVQKKFPYIAELKLQEEIARLGKLMHFRRGDILLDYGSYIKMVPLVIDGSIKVVRADDEYDNELYLYFLTAGHTCSMSFSCCMMDKRSDIRTIAEEDTTIIGIPIRYVDEWMMKYSSWKSFVMRSYDQRMQELVRTIDNIVFRKLDERLLLYLEQKSNALNSKLLHGTHQEIALDLNASREAISRILKQLEKMGRIQLGRNKIKLL
ncbi:MAG TPA: Crp/Fnr family transcriptional regulator [Phaeodactylibacter sp.]|nr:Crp/Fnr family transcriptional regulator [Phaeodactylibacter sp.]